MIKLSRYEDPTAVMMRIQVVWGVT